MTNELRAAFATVLMAGMISAHAQTTTTSTNTSRTPTTTKTTTTTTTHKRSSAAARRRPVEHRESSAERELRELREEMKAQNDAQRAETDALKAQLAAMQAASSAKDAQVTAAQSDAANATAQVQQTLQQIQANKEQVDTLNQTVGDLKIANVGLAQTISTNKQELSEAIESPTTIHYKGVTITPVAFFAFEGVERQRSVNSGLNTPFNSIPFPNSNEDHISELNFSGRQSRIGGLFEGNAGAYKLSGYIEADFLSSGTTSNANQSNSYTLRQRQFWGKAETKRGFAVTGGQMWSLVTETGKSTDTRTEKLPNTIDPQYVVGYNWTRQPAIRFQQKFGTDASKPIFTAAMSLENAQLQSFTATNGPTNFIFAGAGTGGGLYNSTANYLNSVAPDVIVKGTLDLPKAHLEAGGIARFFRDEYYPLILNTVTGATTGYAPNAVKNTKTGGGVFGSARVSPSHFVDIAVQAMAGQGVGRYGSAQLADATVHPDGTLEPIRNYHGLASLETHPTKKLDIYGYYGGEYAQRTVYTNFTGGLTGYGPKNVSDAGCYIPAPNVTTNTGSTGSPASTAACGSPTRFIEEGVVGFTYRVVSSPRYGRLQYQFTYSYIQRASWSGLFSGTYGTANATYITPRAEDGMFHVGMRYYIP
jgi:hypothetical protein